VPRVSLSNFSKDVIFFIVNITFINFRETIYLLIYLKFGKDLALL